MLAERCVRTAEATGSIPVISTKPPNHLPSRCATSWASAPRLSARLDTEVVLSRLGHMGVVVSRHGRLVSAGRADSLVAAIILAAAVAAVFRPLRRGIQRALDRR
jgi:hypothetical protein